jgi:hypothetical protein
MNLFITDDIGYQVYLQKAEELMKDDPEPTSKEGMLLMEIVEAIKVYEER